MGDNKLQCEVCNRRFVSDQLIHHYFSHLKNKIYPCKFCFKLIFKKILDLNIHLQSYHKISRSYNCPKCREELFCLYEFMLHIRNVHSVEKNTPNTKSKEGKKFKLRCKDSRKNCKGVISAKSLKKVNADLPSKSSGLEIFPVSEKDFNNQPTNQFPCSRLVDTSSLEITSISNRQNSSAHNFLNPVNNVLITVVPNKSNEKNSVLCNETKSSINKDETVTVQFINNGDISNEKCSINNNSTLTFAAPKNPLTATNGANNISVIEKMDLPEVFYENENEPGNILKEAKKQCRRVIKLVIPSNLKSNNLDINPSIKLLNRDNANEVKLLTEAANCSSPNKETAEKISIQKPVCKSDESFLIKNRMQNIILDCENKLKRATFINKNNTINDDTDPNFSFTNEISFESDVDPKTKEGHYFSKREHINEKVLTYKIIEKVSVKNKQFLKHLPNTNQVQQRMNVKTSGIAKKSFDIKSKLKDIKLIKKYLKKQKMQLLQECKELIADLNPDDFPVLKSISTTVTQRDINKFLPIVLVLKLSLHQYMSIFDNNDKLKNIGLPKEYPTCAVPKPNKISNAFDKKSFNEINIKKNVLNYTTFDYTEKKKNIVFLKKASISCRSENFNESFVEDKQKKCWKTYNNKFNDNDLLMSSVGTKMNNSFRREDDLHKTNHNSQKSHVHRIFDTTDTLKLSSDMPETLLESKFQQILFNCGTEITSSYTITSL